MGCGASDTRRVPQPQQHQQQRVLHITPAIGAAGNGTVKSHPLSPVTPTSNTIHLALAAIHQQQQAAVASVQNSNSPFNGGQRKSRADEDSKDSEDSNLSETYTPPLLLTGNSSSMLLQHTSPHDRGGGGDGKGGGGGSNGMHINTASRPSSGYAQVVGGVRIRRALSRHETFETDSAGGSPTPREGREGAGGGGFGGLGLQRTTTFGRRSSFGYGRLLPDENAWRHPKQAQEMITQHQLEDPTCFRDHVALYWRLEHLPSVAACVGETTTELALAASSSSRTDQFSIFLSLGPSSGSGDKIGSSEFRPYDTSTNNTATAQQQSMSFHPMLLPYHSMNGGDPNFSLQVQVWLKRVSNTPNPTPTAAAPSLSTPPSPPTPSTSATTSMTLLGYLDLTLLLMFAAFEKGQGLLLRSPPSSVMNGTVPIALPGTMLVIDYIQFYCHTTAAVTATPSRWPKELCTPQADCLWRGQIHAIKLGVPRGCSHTTTGMNLGGSNNYSGLMTQGGKDSQQAMMGGVGSSGSGVCFFQMWRLHVTTTDPAAASVAPSPDSTPPYRRNTFDSRNPSSSPSPTSSPANIHWRLVHTSEFLPLSRNPRFSEFQRSLTDICRGDYDGIILFQVVVSHENLKQADFMERMANNEHMLFSDPAVGVVNAAAGQDAQVCSIVQATTTMRELLAGKTKLKLQTPVSNGSSGDLIGTATTRDEMNTTVAGQDDAPSALGHGTLAFNISQIFSSRASLEAISRTKLLEAGLSPQQDGFDEVGVARSTAYLSSLLPQTRRSHHRPASHLRGTSGRDSPGNSSPVPSNRHPPLQRSKTSSAFELHGRSGGGGSTSSNSAIIITPMQPQQQHSHGQAVNSLLDKMGIGDSGATSPAIAPPRRASLKDFKAHANKRRSV